MKNIDKKLFLKKLVLFLVGLFISGVGVAITKRGNLGVSPISSVANILSMRFTWLTLGNWLIIWNCVLILGQIVILGKEFQWYQLLQIPLSFLFGYFTDFGMFISKWMESDSYPARIGCVLLGTAVLGLGIAITVHANLIMNSGEAIVKAISDKWNREFSNVKMCFDIGCVSFSILLSLLLFEWEIVGTREGTIIAAVCTGLCVKFFRKIIVKISEKKTK